MDHTPFILASYLVSAIVLTWCAVGPVIRGKKLKRALVAREARRAS